VKDEDIYDEDGSSSGWREEDFKKYFKAWAVGIQSAYATSI
jgi:hypothetical protein